MYRIYYKTNYPLGMGGIREGRKWIIIIWIWVPTKMNLSIPSPVPDLGKSLEHTHSSPREGRPNPLPRRCGGGAALT
jgi:hypothetical protein